MIYNVEVEVTGENGDGEPLPPQPGGGDGRSRASVLQYSGGTLDDQPSAYGGDGYGVEAEEPEPVTTVEQRRVDEHEQLGRNDPCWCGSGKKFKKCHGA